MTDKKKEYMKLMKTLLNIGYWIVFGFLILVGLFVIATRFETPLNARLFTVMSGSMEPAIKTGSIVVVQSEETYAVGDVITYKNGTSIKNTVTHRITEITGDPDIGSINYVTKGDANEGADPLEVSSANVIGKVKASVPLLGYIIGFAQTQTGFIVLIIVPATLIIYTEVMNIKKQVAETLAKRKAAGEKVPETTEPLKSETTAVPERKEIKKKTGKSKDAKN